MRVAVVLSALVALGQAQAAFANPPELTITTPFNLSVSNNTTPTFKGFAEAGDDEVALDIYDGPVAAGPVVQELPPTRLFFQEGSWSIGPAEPLNDGIYTAQAVGATGARAAVTFTVDTVAPTVTLNSPESPSDNTTPSFTGTASDTINPVTVQVHAGATAKGPVESLATAAGTGSDWTSGETYPALPVGEYTAIAVQESSIGNPTGTSSPVTFSVVAPPIAAPERALGPPTASFKWFPPMPQTGEPVSLVSSSTDAASPITALAWSLASTDPFENGGSVLNTSFSTPGPHAVRLRVINAAGLASVATETIDVVARATLLMQPFPVVRIAGSYNVSGVKLRLLRVQQMPAGARVTVRCKGRGCPLRSASRLAVSTKQGVAQIEFKRFERWLSAGVSLEILVSKQGEIGKYTRFRVRRAKLPERVDMCLEAMGMKPLACPSS
ncbi:MAG TPA: PKD domain-containing protein [Solirubrobacteraceae bacterium]|jgi:hypothetical protein|nr:PKD domain-containing protein [Solirubrobacteraceae bacterium]